MDASVPPPPAVPEAWLPNKLRKRQGLLDHTDVPARQKVPFIHWGYRPPPAGPWDLIRSIFRIHNETGNIWSHLIGAGYFAWVGVDAALGFSRTTSFEQQATTLWIFLLVVASAYCCVCSVVFHLCSCAHVGVRDCTYKMDLTGIVILIAASYFTGIALGYRCYPALRSFYLAYAALISVALAVPLLKRELVKDLAQHMVLCVVLGLVPAVHFLCAATGKEAACVLPYLLLMFGSYGAGACFYFARWPECCWPGYFDIVGHSHQFWHLFVLMAAVCWLQGCRAMTEIAMLCEVLDVPDEGMILP